jgi:antitoxin CptB
MDDHRKKLRFRAWRRGFREIDLILGRFADAKIADLTTSQLVDFERMLDAPDQDVYAWIVGAEPTPAEFETETMALIRAFTAEAAQQS